jgi:hypothetical protein
VHKNKCYNLQFSFIGLDTETNIYHGVDL